MHGLGGLTWGEWASLIAIITFLAGLISLLFKYAIFGPFRGDIKELNQNFTLLNHNLAELKSDISRLDERADEHDRRLDRHHERLKSLGGYK
ncbi:hypothetical protein ACEN4A_01260 [Latilactobacillus sakei]|uniref:hypothetical protein n=1 Tax=Latilactobacillus sakei TaxID=1599 RepID=UPI0038899BBD